jgi:CIC family chloride channel protein
MGLFVPQVMGVGYEYVGQVLNNGASFGLKLMLLLIVLKLFAVTTSYGSGNAGGIFGPALFLGAMTGGAVGTLAHHLFPLQTALPGAYALVGMGAVFAGVVRAPMTSVLMIFEMTQDYAVIVPLMIANMVSLYIASRLQHEPIYEALAVQDGIHLPSGPSRVPGAFQIARVMQAPAQILPAETTVQQTLERIQATGHQSWIVTDGQGIRGVVTLKQLQETPPETHAQALADLLDPASFPHVHTDQGLDLALERLGANHLDILPVVNRADIHKLEGIVTLRNVLEAYGVGEGRERQ